MSKWVEYTANNSGGRWWLSDDDWRALERAGWRVKWATLESEYTDDGRYIYDDAGLPKLVPVGSGNRKYPSFQSADGLYLGALAISAIKPGTVSIKDAAEEWERITGQCATDVGCPCCGPPHHFTAYVDGNYVESGPDLHHEMRW